MYASLLRRLTAEGFRKGLAGSNPWLIAGVVVAGLPAHGAHRADDEAVLYRTAVKAGDVFEVITRAKQ